MTRAPRSSRLHVLAAAILVASQANAQSRPLTDKTLVAWVAPANLTQRGGSVLTIEKPGGVFDAIVLGERAVGRWMAGSNSFSRTEAQQDGYPAETAGPEDLVQLAIVYAGRRITLYRDGARYAGYTASGAESFGDDSLVVIGLRHLDAGKANRFFAGAVDDARIYAGALSEAQIRALRPNRASEPRPVAWWDFEQGRAVDRMRTFTSSTLVAGARIDGGRLHLDPAGGYLVAERKTPHAGRDRSRPDSMARALREKLLADPYRPGYHFVTPEGRCMPFDPNGAIYWKGRYHLFYIFQDGRGHNWGHVSSTDLLHWRHHPTGLTAGMFSGNCFINKAGRPTMCYHQVGQGNAMAVAVDDELNEWRKLDTNPITPNTSPGDPHHGKYRSWDPFGWVENGKYYAIFGGKRPAVARAPTLGGPWEYVGDLLANTVPGVSIHEDVSCADMFEIGGRHMLLCISHRLGCRYYLGDWKNEQFHPTSHGMMSWVDNSFFAPESLLDDRGRRIMWAWIFDGPGFRTRTDHGWSGTMSLPRVLSLGDDGTLRMRPPRELERLRYNPRERAAVRIGKDATVPLDGIAGNSIELGLRIRVGDAAQVGVAVCRSTAGEEQTLVYYDAKDGKLKIDTTGSSLRSGAKTIEGGPLVLKGDEVLELQVFVDKSVVEVFANGRQAVMRRIYPSRRDSVGVALFARGGSAEAVTVRAWEMMPANPY